jgi:hypothetical protein
MRTYLGDKILRLKNIIIISVILVLFAYSIPALMMVYSDIKGFIMMEEATAESKEGFDSNQFSALLNLMLIN